MSPQEKLENIKRSLGVTTIEKFPENVASDEVGHFMMITEYQFKNTNTKNRDALTRFSEQITTTAPYESRNAFALYLPKGSLKTQYSASHEKVDFGFFGALLNSESSDILNRLQAQLPGIMQSDRNDISKSFNFYKNIATTVGDELSPNVNRYINQDMSTKMAFNIGQAVGGLLLSKDKTASVASLSMRKTGNPYSTLVFAGVKERRQHAFSFDFYPRSSLESENILKIITKLKAGMLPDYHKPDVENKKKVEKYQVEKLETKLRYDVLSGLSTNVTSIKTKPASDAQTNLLKSAFFNYPNVYTIKFYKTNGTKNEFLHQIGQSSILNLKLSYGEGGQQVFFKNGAPQHVKMDITFKENFALSRNLAKNLEG
tara:strand:- start:2806 stop:3921 length:1116 start_codon:yes stop_codon:yes gene_type:complete